MNRILPISLIVFALCLPLACAKTGGPTTDGLRIAVSIYPLQDLTRQITGGRMDVFHLVPAGANPHHFEPPPSMIRQLQGTDLFVGVHPDFDGWIETLLPAGTPRMYLHPDSNRPKTAAADSSGTDAGFNPHFWLSVCTVRDVLPRLTRALCRADTLSCGAFRRNLEHYQSRLDSLDLAIRNRLEPFRNAAFIQWHPAWDGFAADYGLRITATLEHGHGEVLPARSFHRVIRQAREQDVRLVVIGLNTESRTADALVRELDGRLLRLDALGGPDTLEGNTYVNLMSHNARLLAETLGEMRGRHE